MLRQRANLLAQSSANPVEVEAAYREAIDCARDQEAKLFELECTSAFARWLKGKRCTDEARTILTKVYASFTEGFDTEALKEAKTLLDEMTKTPKKRLGRSG